MWVGGSWPIWGGRSGRWIGWAHCCSEMTMAMSEAEREAFVRGFEALVAATGKQLPRNVRSQRTILRREAAVDRETMFAAKMLLFDMRMMGAGLHVTDDGELWQMRRPLLGYERIA